VTLVNTDVGAGTTDVRFDLHWENSWRASWEEGTATITNWDAAWVFIKYRQSGSEWKHAWLSASGHTAPGMTIDIGSNGGATNMGAFLYRSSDGYGNVDLTNVKLRWNYAANGVGRTNQIDVSVNAVEMVYVPQGSFSVGSGGTESSPFYAYPNSTVPYPITNENEITVEATNGMLYYSGASAGIVSNVFPKGYAAFYCMKYEVTQGQYTEFLNQLPSAQASTRYSASSSGSRYTIGTGVSGTYTNAAPDRACNWLSWADGAAYADWVGLRPMTELEFEKACRGPKTPVADEYAWGDAIANNTTAISGTDGSGTDTVSPTTANCLYGGAVGGPVRVGIYATNHSIRTSSGAGYYGTMETSGNVYERPVTVGHATGRLFTGLHGDGVLDGSGNANVSGWPGTDGVGAGCRGGGWDGASSSMRMSDRGVAISWPDRSPSRGFRGVRSAP
jgi:formylglycine-generating enzyme required for sulfatase activity